MANSEYKPSIIVTDAGTPNGEVRVTDLNSGNSVVVDNQADIVCDAIRGVNGK